MKKPNIVKGIPTLLVRALPALYYFGRFADGEVPSKAKIVFDSYVRYLTLSLERMTLVIPSEELSSIAGETALLQEAPTDKIEPLIFDITQRLSDVCQKNGEILKAAYAESNGLKAEFERLFCEVVQKTSVLVFDNANDEVRFINTELPRLWRIPFSDETEQPQNELRERIKELNCLYGVSQLAERHFNNLDNLLEELAFRL